MSDSVSQMSVLTRRKAQELKTQTLGPQPEVDNHGKDGCNPDQLINVSSLEKVLEDGKPAESNTLDKNPSEGESGDVHKDHESNESNTVTAPQPHGSQEVNNSSSEMEDNPEGNQKELVMKAKDAETEVPSKTAAADWIRGKFAALRCNYRIETLEQSGVRGSQLEWRVNLQLPGFSQEENKEVVERVNNLIAKELAGALQAKVESFRDLGPAPDEVADNKLQSRVTRFNMKLEKKQAKLASTTGEAGTSTGEENTNKESRTRVGPAPRKTKPAQKSAGRETNPGAAHKGKAPLAANQENGTPSSSNADPKRTENKADSPTPNTSHANSNEEETSKREESRPDPRQRGAAKAPRPQPTHGNKDKGRSQRGSKDNQTSTTNRRGDNSGQPSREGINSELGKTLVLITKSIDRLSKRIGALEKGNGKPPSQSKKRLGGGGYRRNHPQPGRQ